MIGNLVPSGEMKVRGTLARLWRGEMPLPIAFWQYAIAYGFLINVLATGGMLTAHVLGAPIFVSVTVFFLPVPYLVFVVISVWRSAERYHGDQRWADLARTGVIIWVFVATFL